MRLAEWICCMRSIYPPSVPGIYQCFCYVWHMQRGDPVSARTVMMIPPQMMTPFDDLMRAAWIAGARDALNP